jgi:hypothetical protein
LQKSDPNSRSGGCGRGGFLFGRGFFAFEIRVATLALFNFVRLFSHKSLLCRQNCFVYWRNMKTWFRRFNIYFALAAVFLAGGCDSVIHDVTKSKKEQTTLRLYMEGGRADSASRF